MGVGGGGKCVQRGRDGGRRKRPKICGSQLMFAETNQTNNQPGMCVETIEREKERRDLVPMMKGGRQPFPPPPVRGQS